MVKFKFFFLIIIFVSSKSFSHHKIYSPRVEEGRTSLEWRGHFNHDRSNENNKEHHHVFESENSWTNFWQSEIEFHVSDKSDTPLDWEKLELQNQLQLYDSESYAAALYFSYNFIFEGSKADEIEYKFLNEYSNKYLKFITNFIFEKGVGKKAHGSTEFSLTNYLVSEKPIFEEIKIGIIGFSELGYLTKIKPYHRQEHMYGIQFERDININNIEYEFVLGYLKGLTSETSNHSFIWNIELEF
ncbi:hypothetical protein OA848_04215 [Rickettsiales bacterium]|nr:hypothetical protein [Rickettsiales bacterium]